MRVVRLDEATGSGSPAGVADLTAGAAAPPAPVVRLDQLSGGSTAAARTIGVDELAARRARETPGPARSGATAPPPDTSHQTDASNRPEDRGRPDATTRAAEGRTGRPSRGRAGETGVRADSPRTTGKNADLAGRASDGERAGERGTRRRGVPRQVDPDADPVAAAREICLRLLTDRARTRHELAVELRRRGVPDDASTVVLERFDQVGLIDDAAFAGQWVRSRHGFRGLGRRAIAVELRRKGVADEVAGEALADIDAEAESRRARELVDRKLRSAAVATADERAVVARRLVGMLARKGYGASTAYRVVREALAAHGADAGELDGPDPGDDR